MLMGQKEPQPKSLLRAPSLLRMGPKNRGQARDKRHTNETSGKHLVPALLTPPASALRAVTADEFLCQPFSGGNDASTYIVLQVEVTASLQQNLDHREMALIGSKVQGGPAMLLKQRKQLVSELDTPRDRTPRQEDTPAFQRGHTAFQNTSAPASNPSCPSALEGDSQ